MATGPSDFEHKTTAIKFSHFFKRSQKCPPMVPFGDIHLLKLCRHKMARTKTVITKSLFQAGAGGELSLFPHRFIFFTHMMDFLTALDRGELLSPQQAADRLGVSLDTIRRWIRAKKLRAFKLGGRWKIPLDALNVPAQEPLHHEPLQEEPPLSHFTKRKKDWLAAEKELKRKFGI